MLSNYVVASVFASVAFFHLVISLIFGHRVRETLGLMGSCALGSGFTVCVFGRTCRESNVQDQSSHMLFSPDPEP